MPKIETSRVLVASQNIEPGQVIQRSDIEWQEWPEDNIADTFVSADSSPKPLDEMLGHVARTSFVRGEPIRQSKLIKAGPGEFLSAVLPSGMRAVSTKTSPPTGAGGFILPNDRVDVILTRREADPENDGREVYISETVLRNVRVLAIDQSVEEKDGKKVVVGNVATLELKPSWAETIALAEQLGDISLSLRSILDGNPAKADEAEAEINSRHSGSVTMIKFGVAKQVTASQ